MCLITVYIHESSCKILFLCAVQSVVFLTNKQRNVLESPAEVKKAPTRQNRTPQPEDAGVSKTYIQYLDSLVKKDQVASCRKRTRQPEQRNRYSRFICCCLVLNSAGCILFSTV